MRIGISQIDTRAGDLKNTAGRMVDISHAAAARGVELLMFPVAALTGPSPVDFGNQDAFLADLMETLSWLASHVAVDCLVPVVLCVNDQPVIEVLHLHEGASIPLRFGAWAVSSFARNLTDGPQMGGRADTELVIGDTRMGMAFSYEDLDSWCAARNTPDVVCFFSNYGYAVDDASSALGSALVEGRYREDATELGSWLVGVGSLGAYDLQVFSGASFVLEPDGRLVASSPAFEEDLLVADVGANAALEPGEELRPELYDERYHLWQALVLGVRDYVHKLDKADVALALDGSLASMLLATIATDALGPAHVHALLCAPPDSPRHDDVPKLAHALRISTRPLPNAPTDDTLFAADLAMAHLASLAREVNGIPLLPADKTALALEAHRVGSCPAALAPLGDVYRVDVLDVARLRNTISPVFPSLEISPADVPHIGIDVPEWGYEGLLEHMDAAVAAHVEGERSLSEVIATVGNEEVVTATLRAFRDEEHARLGRFACLMMTTRTLADAHMPVGFAWHDQAREDADDAAIAAIEEALRQAISASEPMVRDGERRSSSTVGDAEMREALELLRDIAMGSTVDWRTLFSEN